jgi:hypothetical protein
MDVFSGVFDQGQSSVMCHSATGSDADAVVHGQAILRAFVGLSSTFCSPMQMNASRAQVLLTQAIADFAQ